MNINKIFRKTYLLKRLIKYILLKKRESFPRLLSIELTNACNSDCIMCPRSKLTRKITQMDFDLFKKTIDDCKGHRLRKINLFWFGETFIYPKLPAAIKYIKEGLPKTKVNISTNGALVNGEIAEKIIDSGLDTLNFDIDGATKQTFESIRRNLNFEQVTENVKNFMTIRKKLEKKKPRVSVTIIKMDKTVGEIDSFINYWKDIVDHVGVNDYNTWLGTVEDLNVGEKKEKSSTGKFTFPCDHPFNELAIAVDGRATMCCLDSDCSEVMGNLKENSIKEIWTGEKIIEKRQLLIENKYDQIQICKNCNSFIFQERSVWANVWQ
ncbi:radical SAM/SPASM domain-containing protein [candidate division KSB1 bacterium]